MLRRSTSRFRRNRTAATFEKSNSSWRGAARRSVFAALADRAFMAIATAEGEIHGMPPEEVHLHEVGAVDAILDVVGVIWGLEMLGVERVYCGNDRARRRDGASRAWHACPFPRRRR